MNLGPKLLIRLDPPTVKKLWISPTLNLVRTTWPYGNCVLLLLLS